MTDKNEVYDMYVWRNDIKLIENLLSHKNFENFNKICNCGCFKKVLKYIHAFQEETIKYMHKIMWQWLIKTKFMISMFDGMISN